MYIYTLLNNNNNYIFILSPADVGMSSEVVVNDGDPVTLCCEPTGSAPLVNEWFRIRRDANGIPFEERVNDTLIDDYSIDPT